MSKRLLYRKQRYFRDTEINTKNHWAQDFCWMRESSRTKETYLIHMHDQGWTCTCVGFSVRGQCKHINDVRSRFLEDE